MRLFPCMFHPSKIMNDSEIREYLLDFQARELPELIERDLRITESNRIKTIIGPRRAGKTYVMYQKIRELLESGISKENILYINLEDPRLIDVDFKAIRRVITTHWSLYPSSTESKNFVFIDEPQNVEQWEIAVRALHDEGFNIYLSGSSSRLLSKEIATRLRGRTISYTLLPFSFREFLRMKGTGFDVTRLSSRKKAVLIALLGEYTELGGFPEIILEPNEDSRGRMLKEYLDLIVYRDVIERYQVRNTRLIKWLVNALTNSYAREFSVHKTYSTLTSRGMHVSKNTLYSYLSMLEDALFVYFLRRFTYSARKTELSIHKTYLCDVGFPKLTEVTEDKGHKLENIVFLELQRRKRPFTEIYYWKNQYKEEVDFVIKERSVKQLIQVCYEADNPDTRKRELRALEKASKELHCSNLLVITWNYEARKEIKGDNVEFIPVWKWLLTV